MTARSILVTLGALGMIIAGSACSGSTIKPDVPATVPPAETVAAISVEMPIDLLGAGKPGKGPLLLTAIAAGEVSLEPSLPQLRHLAVEAGDLLDASVILATTGRTGKLDGASITLHLRRGEDSAERLLATLPLPAEGKDLDLGTSCSLLAKLAASEPDGPAPRLILRLTGAPAEAGLRLAPQGRLVVSLRQRATHALFPAQPAPRVGVWTQVKDGHFDYGGQRLRLWGPCVHWSAVSDNTPDRLIKMGANAVRLWGPPRTWYTADEVRRGVAPAGNQDMEIFDRFIAACYKRGMFIMAPMLSYDPAGQMAPFDVNGHKEMTPIGKALLADDSWIAGGDDWAAWKEAVATKGSPIRLAVYFDERLSQLRRRHAETILGHLNPFTGRRLAEEPAIALWEVDNENGFIHWAVQKGFAQWPAYFREKLQRRWNAWLAARYPDRAALVAAWGALNEGEDTATSTVLLAPILPERERYPKARAADFVRFLVELTSGWNRDFIAFCRAQAPAGTGIAVAPMSADTLYQNNPAWLYANASAGDVNCIGTYSFTLTSTLDGPPSFFILDHSTVAGKPTVLYEVNAGRPNPYRAEFPFRIAALAAWQDWDGAFWHLWKSPKGIDVPDEHYLTKALAYPSTGDYTTCVNNMYDPAMCAATAAAGDIFLRGLISPAPAPTTFTVGKQAVFSLDHLRGLPIGRAAFTNGARIAFAPEEDIVTRSDREVPALVPDQPLASGEQIAWDWPNGRLIIDTPCLKAYIGRTAGTFRFRDGIAVGEVGAPWVAFSLVSADGLPLAGATPSRRVLACALGDAWNTGFRREAGGEIASGGFIHPLQQLKMITDLGRTPVVQQRIPFTVWLPRTLDGRFDGYDFATRRCTTQPVAGSNRLRYEGEALFMGVLNADNWGAAAPVPASTPPVARESAARIASAPTRRVGAWLPIAELDWGLDADLAHQILRDSTQSFEAVSALRSDGAGQAFTATGLRLFDTTTDTQLSFQDQRLAVLTVSFRDNPGIAEIAGRCQAALGEPTQRDLRSNAFESSTVRWNKPVGTQVLSVVLTETQGVLSLVARLGSAP